MMNSLLDTGVRPINDLTNVKPAQSFRFGGPAPRTMASPQTPEESLSEPPVINLAMGGASNPQPSVQYPVPEMIKMGDKPFVSRPYNMPLSTGIASFMGGGPAMNNDMGGIQNFTNQKPFGLMGLLQRDVGYYRNVT